MLRNNYVLLWIMLVLIFVQCARVSSPSGGKKDEIPPKVKKSEPGNYSTQFEEKEVEIFFDEFVTLKDIFNKFIISPPVERNPEIKEKGKSILIEIPEELMENTTYTLQFGDAIQDLNEGNPLLNYVYVFSTGNEIDSLGITGRLADAFTLEPKENMYVGLYGNLEDSVPMLQKPFYIAKTDAKGQFYIPNIKTGTFRILAFNDLDQNMMYMPGEEVAFSDTLLTLTPQTLIPLPKDTLSTDSLKADSLMIDTTYHTGKAYKFPEISLYLSQEDVKKQYVTDNSRKSRERLTVAFNRAVKDSISLSAIHFNVKDNWYIEEYIPSLDTLYVWLTDSTLIRSDSLDCAITYITRDSIDQKQVVTDTLYFDFLEKKEVPDKRRKSKEEEKDKKPEKPHLKIQFNAKDKGVFSLGQRVYFLSPAPVQQIIDSLFRIEKKVDTLYQPLSFSIIQDSIQIRKFYLQFDMEESKAYHIFIKPGAIKDIYQLANDTLQMNFTTDEIQNYGNLKIILDTLPSPLIIQLEDPNKKVMAEIYTTQKEATFHYIKPGKYRLKAIYDRNGNRQWDPGHYLKGIQPEKVKYHDKEILIRGNWDHEEPWSLAEEKKITPL